jgi:hypothetical protein
MSLRMASELTDPIIDWDIQPDLINQDLRGAAFLSERTRVKREKKAH